MITDVDTWTIGSLQALVDHCRSFVAVGTLYSVMVIVCRIFTTIVMLGLPTRAVFGCLGVILPSADQTSS